MDAAAVPGDEEGNVEVLRSAPCQVGGKRVVGGNQIVAAQEVCHAAEPMEQVRGLFVAEVVHSRIHHASFRPQNADSLAIHLKFGVITVELIRVAQLAHEPIVVDLNHENIDLIRANGAQVLNAINHRITHAIPMPVIAFKNHRYFFHFISQVFGEEVFFSLIRKVNLFFA